MCFVIIQLTYGSGEGQFNDQRPESVSPNWREYDKLDNINMIEKKRKINDIPIFHYFKLFLNSLYFIFKRK